MRAFLCIGIVAALAMASGAIAMLASQSQGMDAISVAHAQTETSGCSVAATRTLSSSAIRACESCGAKLEVFPHCPPEPFNVVLVLTGYAAPGTSAERLAQRWTEAAIEALAMPSNPHVQVGVVYVRRTAIIRSELTNREGDVSRASRVDRVPVGAASGDWPCYSCGFEQAARVLGESDRGRNAVVFIGGMVEWPLIEHDDDSYYRDWLRGARNAKGAAETLIVGCPWTTDCKEGAGFPWYREASPGYYFSTAGPGRFAGAIEDLVPGPLLIAVESLAIDETVPVELAYLVGSAVPAPTDYDPATGRLRWSFTAPITDSLPITLTYRVKPRDSLSAAITTTFAGGRVLLTDTDYLTRTLLAPSTVLTITGACAPIVTPTATPTKTNIPPTPSATPTSSPTATATLIPQPVYLPLSLREVPCTRTQPADVVLVMDASTSMEEPAGDGRTKIEAARSAAVAFIELLQLDVDDQAAIIAFNSDARIVIGLSGDGDALVSALDGITTASQTCLVCGLEAAGEALQSDSRIIANQPVVILLTDGRSNPSPASEAVDEAARLKADGVVIFTIGLGAELDDAALTAIASKPSFAFRASDGTALEEIYREIAVTLPGPADCYWGRRRADPRRSSRSSSGALCASDSTASPAIATPSAS